MEQNTALAEVLNDLVEINHDRIEGYQRATDEAQDVDVDLKAIFAEMSNKSKRFATELSHEVSSLGETPAEGTTNRGKVYRVWMDIKKAFATNDRQAILESCEFGEDAAQRAYETALSSDEEINSELRQLIMSQKESLKKDHDLIKKYRDMHKAVNSSI
jgi:uncharacterized protein (TIGR02284 family)